jgi:hypothetical protein
MIALVAVALAFVAAGFAVGRWQVLLAAAAAVPLYFGGVLAGWWGSGVGDGWQFALAVGTALGTAAAALGVASRRLAHRREPRLHAREH